MGACTDDYRGSNGTASRRLIYSPLLRSSRGPTSTTTQRIKVTAEGAYHRTKSSRKLLSCRHICYLSMLVLLLLCYFGNLQSVSILRMELFFVWFRCVSSGRNERSCRSFDACHIVLLNGEDTIRTTDAATQTVLS